MYIPIYTVCACTDSVHTSTKHAYAMYLHVFTKLILKRGSNVYEVNQWLWRFARGKPRLGGLSVEETDDRKDAAQKVRNPTTTTTDWARR